MASAVTLSIIYNFIASCFCWGGFGLAMSAITSHRWIYSGIIRSGLWKVCVLDNRNCADIPADPWIQATRAFLIMFIVVVFAGGMFNQSSQCNYDSKLRRFSGDVIGMAGGFGIIAAAVYTGVMSQTTVQFTYGDSFAFAWTAPFSSFLANGFNRISAYYMEKVSEEDKIKITCMKKSEKV